MAEVREFRGLDRAQKERFSAVIVDAFVHPLYKLFDWTMANGNYGARPEARLEYATQMTKWIVDFCIEMVDVTGGVLIAVVEGDKVLGAASVARYEDRREVSAITNKFRDVSRVLSTTFKVVGMPPPVRPSSMFKYGMGPTRRFMALDKLDEVRLEVTEGRAHLYLQQIGTASDAQKRGVGAKMLTRLCELCDAEGLLCYLETDEPHLRAMYEKFGFVCKQEYAVKDFTPNYAMLRSPGGQR